MGLSCSSSIKQPQTVSKARLVSMLTTPAFFIHRQEQVTFSWGSLLKAKCLLPPPTEERTRLFGRSLALLHHNTLAMQKRTYLASIGFLVAFHFHVCEKLIHLCIQLAHSQKRKSSTPTSKRFWGPAPPLVPSYKVGSWTVLRPQLVSQLSC